MTSREPTARIHARSASSIKCHMILRKGHQRHSKQCKNNRRQCHRRRTPTLKLNQGIIRLDVLFFFRRRKQFSILSPTFPRPSDAWAIPFAHFGLKPDRPHWSHVTDTHTHTETGAHHANALRILMIAARASIKSTFKSSMSTTPGSVASPTRAIACLRVCIAFCNVRCRDRL